MGSLGKTKHRDKFSPCLRIHRDFQYRNEGVLALKV